MCLTSTVSSERRDTSCVIWMHVHGFKSWQDRNIMTVHDRDLKDYCVVEVICAPKLSALARPQWLAMHESDWRRRNNWFNVSINAVTLFSISNIHTIKPQRKHFNPTTNSSQSHHQPRDAPQNPQTPCQFPCSFSDHTASPLPTHITSNSPFTPHAPYVFRSFSPLLSILNTRI
jgi:hypothetical protein